MDKHVHRGWRRFGRTDLDQLNQVASADLAGSADLAPGQLGSYVFVYMENVKVEHGVRTGNCAWCTYYSKLRARARCPKTR